MNHTAKLAVIGHGMVSALGNDSISSCAALRAGVSGVRQSILWDPSAGARMNAARPGLHQWWQGSSMLAELVFPAINQCFDEVKTQKLQIKLTQIPIILVTSAADRPLRDLNLDKQLWNDLAIKLGWPLPPGSQVIPGGRTGMVDAFAQAQQILLSDKAPVCIVAGVESFLRQELVNHYLNQNRLLCATNSNGFIPGEAASAVLLSLAQRISSSELIIESIGKGIEKSGAGGDKTVPVNGDGLTNAIKQALTAANVQFNQLNWCLSDSNGERFKFKEYTIAAARLDRPNPSTTRVNGQIQLWHPIEYLGEIGAAILPSLLIWAFEAHRRHYAPGTSVLIHAGEDNGTRVALIARFNAVGA